VGRGVYRFLFSCVWFVCWVFDWLGREVYITHSFLFLFVLFCLGWNCWLFDRFIMDCGYLVSDAELIDLSSYWPIRYENNSRSLPRIVPEILTLIMSCWLVYYWLMSSSLKDLSVH
jgi:hypothetical protein